MRRQAMAPTIQVHQMHTTLEQTTAQTEEDITVAAPALDEEDAGEDIKGVVDATAVEQHQHQLLILQATPPT
jgi:hypothetical protein